MTEQISGHVSLAGAGPGDPGLITVAGADALARADVVIYDRLANPKLLDLAPARAERCFAGKGPNAHAMSQDEINALLIDRARAGKRVVRLKGGDPFVFGRGGEEALALAAAGVPFDVIPGVSSAVAAPAYAGIPVTHRGVAASVAFVTGHEDPTKDEPDVDWERLATAVDTLVLLMGVGQLATIVDRLIAGGRAPETPAAVIEWGTLPRQRVVTGTLGDIVAKATEAAIGPPAVAVVGDAVRLRDTIRWFDTKPLFGLRALVTRTREQASELSRALAAEGAEPVELPAIEIVRRHDEAKAAAAIEALSAGDYAWVLFTSANAVAIFFDLLRERGLDARALRAQAGAIGPGTARALSQHGIIADVTPEASAATAEGLLAALEPFDVRDKRLLLPRAEGARDVLLDGLAARGASVDEVTLYVAGPPRPAPVLSAGEGTRDPRPDAALQSLRHGEIDIATFASSSSVRSLVALLDGDVEPLRRCRIAAIGPVTAQAVEELLGRPPDIVAREHTISGLVQSLIDNVERVRR
jgi:uroporphyrinogen III methyltransferase/synthase